MKKLIIKNINIKNFRNIKALSLIFDEHENIITGENATGKTSILDAIRFMLFNETSDKKKIKNINFIDEKSVISKILPNISMLIHFNSKNIKLEHKNGKWFIDGIEQTNNDKYKMSLAKEFGIDDVNLLFTSISPLILSETLIENKSNASKQLKDSIITVINKKNGNIINQNEFNNCVENIEIKKSEIKEIKRDIKDSEQYLNIIKNDNPSINFDNKYYKDEDVLNSKKMNILLLEKRSYESNKKELESLRAKRQDLDIKQAKAMNDENSDRANYNAQIKKLNILDIFLILITFGLYYIFWTKKKLHSENDVNTYINSIKDNKQCKKEIEEVNKKINEIENKLSPINYQSIIEAIQAFEEQNNSNDFEKLQINKYNVRVKDIESSKDKLSLLEADLTRMQNEKNNMYEKIATILKNEFDNFDLDLMSNETSITLRENGIEWKYLNNATKLNITYQLGDFLKQYSNLNCFTLIDNAESINKIQLNKESQYLISKVTNEKELKLNGKNLY